MDFNCFKDFGDSISAKAQHFDDDHFINLASLALSEFDCHFSWQAADFANFLMTSSVSQQPDLGFSNLPITVYQHRDFYIELLTWTQGTTTIHQHSFSGAFKVLEGSSIHSRYRFSKDFSVNADLHRGEVSHIESEYLTKGDIRMISPGEKGLIHRLFHLEKPSVTLVVRTHGHESYLPQYRLLEPYFAYNDLKYRNDSLTTMLCKLIHVASTIDHQQAVDLFHTQVAKLDFPRLLSVFLGVYKFFGNNNELEDFYRAVKRHHGSLADDLLEVSHQHERMTQLLKARNVSKDPDIRFFLALLLNLPNKESIKKLIRERYPKSKPEQLCADWTLRLGAQREDLSLQLAKLASRSEAASYHLGARIGSAISSLGKEELQRNFLETIFSNQIAERRDTDSKPPWQNELDALKAIRELAPIFY